MAMLATRRAEEQSIFVPSQNRKETKWRIVVDVADPKPGAPDAKKKVLLGKPTSKETGYVCVFVCVCVCVCVCVYARRPSVDSEPDDASIVHVLGLLTLFFISFFIFLCQLSAGRAAPIS